MKNVQKEFEACYYCGMQATEHDHVLPKSLEQRVKLEHPMIIAMYKKVVPCCRECNRIANNILFESLEEKTNYIKSKLKKKYKAVLYFPNWEQEEIDELGDVMRSYIIQQTQLRDIIEYRINYKRQSDQWNIDD